MKMGFNEVINKLQELDKVAYAFQQTIHLAEVHVRKEKYMNVPIELLNKEMVELKAKIEHLKNNAMVNYDNDTSYIDKLLKVSNEEIKEVEI